MKNPYKFMQMPWEEFEIATAGLSLEERGAYTVLMSLYWRSGGPLKLDDAKIPRVLGVPREKWLELKPVVEELFVVDGDLWCHRMMDDLLLQCRVATEKQRQKAAKRWDRRAADEEHVVIRMKPAVGDDFPF